MNIKEKNVMPVTGYTEITRFTGITPLFECVLVFFCFLLVFFLKTADVLMESSPYFVVVQSQL